MEIVNLMNKQNALECEVAELKRKFQPEDKDVRLRYEAAKEEIATLETQICARVKDIVGDPSHDCAQIVENFANAINDAAEQGLPIEDVLFGKESILDPETASCSFKLFQSEDGLVVMGGILTAQCKELPWVLVKVSESCVEVETVWKMSHRDYERPSLEGERSCGFHLDGSYQRAVIGFFRREYARKVGAMC